MTTKKPAPSAKPPKKIKKHDSKPPQATLFSYGFYAVHSTVENKRRVQERLKADIDSAAEAVVSIEYRDDGNIRGKGAYYDHSTVQKITNYKTLIVNPEDSHEHLTEYMSNHTVQKLAKTDRPPESVKEPEGLLFIPGLPRHIKESPQVYSLRNTKTKALLRDALNRGQPILAVCGGSWALWDHLGGELVEVKDHCSAQMPRLLTSGKVGYNIETHCIRFTEAGQILKGAMNLSNCDIEKTFPKVNSVHWKAPATTILPENIDVSAFSKADPSFRGLNRKGRLMTPEQNTIECFESRTGAPILGVQWHPEAYTEGSEDQKHLVGYMAKAGQTYTLKQKLNTEFRKLFRNKKEPGKLTHFLKQDSRAAYEEIETRSAKRHLFWISECRKERPPVFSITRDVIDGIEREVIQIN